MQTLIRRRCSVCQCPSLGFSDSPLYTALWRHSDKNSTANCYLDFAQTRGLMSFVSDNHVDNGFKETLDYVYFGSIVNNRPLNRDSNLIWLFLLDICTATIYLFAVHVPMLSTVELQWLEPRWLVYHGWVEHVLESTGISSKYDIRII